METINQDTSKDSLSKRTKFIVVVGVMFEVFTGSMSHMITATAMPRIITDLSGFNQYTWVFTIFMITSSFMMPLAGKLSDMYGRKWLYISGIGAFVTSSFLCGLSQTMIQLIAFRGLQGLGFGIMITLGHVIMADIFPPAVRGKYMGFISGTFGISAIIGPTLGGFLTDYLSWHWCFFINIPFGVITIVLFIVYFPELRPERAGHSIDYPGVAAMILFMIPLMLSLTWGGRQYAWFSIQILGMLCFSALMLIIFLKLEALNEEPLIPIRIFKNRIFTVSSISVFIAGIAFFSCMTFIPLFLQGVLGSSATLSGKMMTPMVLGLVIGSIVSGQLLSRAGGHYRLQAAIGFAVIAIGLFLLSRMTVETAYSTALLNMVFVGLGQGIIMPLHTIAVQNAVSYSILGTATASINLLRSFGGIFGLAILGSVMNNVFYSDFMGNLKPSIKAAVQSSELSAIAKNPQVLINPAAQSHLKEMLEGLVAQGEAIFQQMLATLQTALNSALREVFLVSFCAIVLGFLINFFLEEIPLRKSIRDEPSLGPADNPAR